MGLAAMAVLAGLIVGLSGFAEAQDKRVALVIGNGKYAHATALANPANDGRGMTAALKRLGFTVTETYDESRAGMERALRAFRQTARASDMALVFYAGHAVQVGAKNHLLPTDAKLADEDDLNYETIPLDLVLSAVEGASKVRVVILDSCRDNPFNAKLAAAMGPGRSAIIGRGLAVAPVGGGNTLIAYATKEGLIAEDGKGSRNSPYTTALLRHIEEPGLDLNQFFGKVRDSVMAATAGQQQPFVYGSLGGERFFLKSPDGAVATPAPSAPAPLDPAAVELAYWNSVKDSQNAGEYEAYLKDYPKGRFAQLARTRITALTPKPAPAAPKPSQPTVGTYDLKPGTVFRDCPDCPEMVVIPAGSFVMGAAPGEEEREGVPKQFRGHSEPQHTVQIMKFSVSRFEAKYREYNNFLNESNYVTRAKCLGTDNNINFKTPGFYQNNEHPAVCVNWHDAKSYAVWLSGKTKYRYRLLTESEWEYSARAGTKFTRYWGNKIENNNSHCRKCGSIFNLQGTAQVGSFRANNFGLYDMMGNVSEWVDDCWSEDYFEAPNDGKANTLGLKSKGILFGTCSSSPTRGGGWETEAWSIRSAARLQINKNMANYALGFRVARDLQ